MGLGKDAVEDAGGGLRGEWGGGERDCWRCCGWGMAVEAENLAAAPRVLCSPTVSGTAKRSDANWTFPKDENLDDR